MTAAGAAGAADDALPAVAVMVVDDNELAAEALQRWFSRAPAFRWIGWASTAEDALALVAGQRPDVVLLDFEMPGIDTLELLPQLTRHARVLMLSGHVRADYIELALQVGACGYIAKDEPIAVIGDLTARAAAGELVLSPAAAKSFLGTR